MKKKLCTLIAIILLLSLLSCKKNESSQQSLTIYSLRGPAGIAMIKLFEEPPKIDGFKINIEALAQSNLMAARLISGEAKIGILPPNTAAKIFTTEAADLRVAAVTGTGMLSLLTSDKELRSINELKGKTVYSTGQGTVVDYVFQRILRHYGLIPGVDVMLNYSLAYPELAQSLAAGKVAIGLLPEPFATMAIMNNQQLQAVCDIQQEWINALIDSQSYSEEALVYPTTVLVIDGAFAEAHPDAVRKILEELESSIQWVMANPAEAAELVEKHELAIRANVAAAAIPKSNYCFIPAAQARSSLEALFAIFLENEPASIGGELPHDSFYLK